MNDVYEVPPELVLGSQLNERVPEVDQRRQRAEVTTILHRLRRLPGVILADEVGMGKTYVALAIAYSVATRSRRGPVIIMVPANLVDKWEQDLRAFCDLYLEGRRPVARDGATSKELRDPTVVRYGVVRHSVDLMKLTDDPARERCHLIFLVHGAMGRRQTDKWVRLALISEALRRHARGKAMRLIKVKGQIHRFLGKLLWAIGEQRAHDWGDELWARLLKTDPGVWKETYNKSVKDVRRHLTDDPVPKSVVRALHRIDLKNLADVLAQMPVRSRGGSERISERLNIAGKALRQVEANLWKEVLAEVRWRSPLLIMDEAHHLKNPGTALARQLQSPDSESDLRTGDGALAKVFDRMLFLTATPFQLGHHELVRVLERFGDVRWDGHDLGDREEFIKQMRDLCERLNDSQRSAISLQRAWSRLRIEDCSGDIDLWWRDLLNAARETLSNRQRAVVDAYSAAKRTRDIAGALLRPWIVRHNKGAEWAGTNVQRRMRVEGGALSGRDGSGGLPIPSQQLLPFFLAARSADSPGKDVLGEALSSSYEAFRLTRKKKKTAKDEQDDQEGLQKEDLSHTSWYLREFDHALEQSTGASHPKVSATVKKVVDLWESGEKVLVFAFYRYTCRALRVHISQEIRRRMASTVRSKLREAGREVSQREVERLITRIQRRYFDDEDSPGRKAVDAALLAIIQERRKLLDDSEVTQEQRAELVRIMRRFLRVGTTLVRCFPIGDLDSITPEDAIARTLDSVDASNLSWRDKIDGFVDFLAKQCTADERSLFLEAAQRTQTRGIRVEDIDEEGDEDHPSTVTVANVQVATGKTKRNTRARLMRAFNTPFFPDILVCSEVMSEGVDLQRFCRHVIHHDLAWNPSTIEQRTGRIDRLGCKAESRQPIMVYLPYLAGAADERQYHVMFEREQWFRVVMGQDEVARLITPDSDGSIPIPESIAEQLSFTLDLDSLSQVSEKGGRKSGSAFPL